MSIEDQQTQNAVVNAKLGAMHEDMGEMKGVLRELTSAITKLALIEQAQIQASLAMERAFKTLEQQGVRLQILETKMPEMSRTSSWVDKFVLIVFTAVLTWGLTTLKGN